jgi:anti-sigma factor (TIGR02949 family)
MGDERVLTCEEALRFLAEFLDGELGTAEDRDVQEHLARCRSCFSRIEFERRLKDRVRALGAADVAPDFATRIRGLLDTWS